MIRSFYGIETDPFATTGCTLLARQQEVYDTLRVHSQQGGLCLVMGVPGTGKTMIKQAIKEQADHKRMLVVSVARTLHTYINTIKILCEAFQVDYQSSQFKCEKRLIEEAYSLNRRGKMLVMIIDDAHLLEMQTLRKLRLLFEDFPRNHNVILIGQPRLMSSIGLAVNEDIRSRITYSTIIRRLNPDATQDFILGQLDRVNLGHNTFTPDALSLVVRSSEGILRKVRNLCISCMLEGVRTHSKTISLEMVNRVLVQPHWQKDHDLQQY